MKTKADILLEMDVANFLLEMLNESREEDWYNEMTTSDIQGVCQAKAMQIIAVVKKAA